MVFVTAQAAMAEPHIVSIPGEGWHLVVDAPPLTSSRGATDGGRFSYSGVDGNSGVTFSVHTEEMKNGTNRQCRDFYWARAEDNPYLVRDSVVFFDTPILLGLTHRSAGDYQGRPFSTVNSHGYFVKNGKCVDLHVSQIPYSDEGKARVENMVRTERVME